VLEHPSAIMCNRGSRSSSGRPLRGHVPASIDLAFEPHLSVFFSSSTCSLCAGGGRQGQSIQKKKTKIVLCACFVPTTAIDAHGYKVSVPQAITVHKCAFFVVAKFMSVEDVSKGGGCIMTLLDGGNFLDFPSLSLLSSIL